MGKRGIGDLARGSLRSLEMANAMQALAVAHIRDQFAATSDFDFDRGVTRAEFIEGLMMAEENGTRDQFEQMMAERMGATWTQIQAAQAQAAAQQGANNG